MLERDAIEKDETGVEDVEQREASKERPFRDGTGKQAAVRIAEGVAARVDLHIARVVRKVELPEGQIHSASNVDRNDKRGQRSVWRRRNVGADRDDRVGVYRSACVTPQRDSERGAQRQAFRVHHSYPPVET